MVVCPYESYAASTPITTTATLKLGAWTWPSNYGPNAKLGKHMRLIWSGEDGSV